MIRSRFGFLVFILSLVILGSGCSQLDRVFARKYLVDGATAYKERKFEVAEGLFRKAVDTDPELETLEGRTAQVFLARTLHSQFISNRKETGKAEEAINEYKKGLAKDNSDQSSFKAVANLLETLGRPDEWLKWMNERAASEGVPPAMRAEAYTLLSAKKYSCANEISDIEPVKKTVNEGGKQVFKFTKPASDAEFQKLKNCADEGIALVDKALELQKQANIESDSTWSYKANLLIQKMRIAEMEGNSAEQERYKKESDVAREKFTALATERRKKEEEEAAKKAAEEAAATGQKAAESK